MSNLWITKDEVYETPSETILNLAETAKALVEAGAPAIARELLNSISTINKQLAAEQESNNGN